MSGALTNALYGTTWLPDPARFNFVLVVTDPVVNAVDKATTHLSATLGPLFTIVIGALLILASVYFLGKLCRKWVVAVYLITAFIVTPALVIILVGVL